MKELLTKVSFISVESSCDTVHVSGGIYAAPLPDNSGHASKHWRLFSCLGKEGSSSNVAEVAIAREDAVSP